MEQSGAFQVRRVALGTLAAIAVLAIGWVVLRGGDRGRGGLEPAFASSRGLVVEVLNGTARPGLARQVTRLLREDGFDVLYFGTADEKFDSTTIFVRRGEAARGHEVARGLGVGRVQVKLDPSRRVDVSVMLGGDYRLPKGRLPL